MTRPRMETEPGIFVDCPDNVVDLASAESVEAAWNRYAVKARELVDAPELLCDRQFNQDLARLHERWKRLFLIQDAVR